MRTRVAGSRRWPLTIAAALCSLLAACGGGDKPAPSAMAEAPEELRTVTFADVTRAAGIRFRHETGAFGKKYLPETMGSGCAWLDYDGDGRQDILLVNSCPFGAKKKKRTPTFPALYRNRGDGTFEDVTERSGLS